MLWEIGVNWQSRAYWSNFSKELSFTPEVVLTGVSTPYWIWEVTLDEEFITLYYTGAFSWHFCSEWHTQIIFFLNKQSIYPAGDLLRPFRLSTLLKGTTSAPYLGTEPTTFWGQAHFPKDYTTPPHSLTGITWQKIIFTPAALLRF